MTIQVGHSLGCPTFFCAPPQGGGSQRVNGSTSLQVGESMGRCPIGWISPIRPMPLSSFFAKNLSHLWHISITISIRYNLIELFSISGGLLLEKRSPKPYFTGLRTGLLCSFKFYRTAIVQNQACRSKTSSPHQTESCHSEVDLCIQT